MQASPPRTSTRSCSAISTPGFSPQDFTAALVLQASPDLRFKRATRVENACATGSAAVHQGIKAIEARTARIVLVVGVEQMTTTPGAGDRPQPAEGILCARGSRYRWRLCRHLRKDRRALFPEIRRPVRRAGHDCGEEPQERRRQSLCADAQGSGLRVLPHRKREESLRRRPAQAHRLLAGVGWRRRGGARRHRDRAQAQQGGRFPRRRARAGFPADGQARHPQIRRLRAGLAARAGEIGSCARRSLIHRDARLLHQSPS